MTEKPPHFDGDKPKILEQSGLENAVPAPLNSPSVDTPADSISAAVREAITDSDADDVPTSPGYDADGDESPTRVRVLLPLPVPPRNPTPTQLTILSVDDSDVVLEVVNEEESEDVSQFVEEMEAEELINDAFDKFLPESSSGFSAQFPPPHPSLDMDLGLDDEDNPSAGFFQIPNNLVPNLTTDPLPPPADKPVSEPPNHALTIAPPIGEDGQEFDPLQFTKNVDPDQTLPYGFDAQVIWDFLDSQTGYRYTKALQKFDRTKNPADKPHLAELIEKFLKDRTRGGFRKPNG